MTSHRFIFASLLMTELGELNNLRIKDNFLQLISTMKNYNKQKQMYCCVLLFNLFSSSTTDFTVTH